MRTKDSGQKTKDSRDERTKDNGQKTKDSRDERTKDSGHKTKDSRDERTKDRGQKTKDVGLWTLDVVRDAPRESAPTLPEKWYTMRHEKSVEML